MKIIAVTRNGTWDKCFLAEITERELRRITGSDTDLNGEIGMSYDVSAAWDRLLKIDRAKEEAKQAADTLRWLALLLEGEMPKVEQATGSDAEPAP